MAFSPDAAFDFLARAHRTGRLAHAYLISGEPGSGKRALTLRLTALVTGTDPTKSDPLKHPDVHAIEPESKSRLIKVEQTRDLEKELQMRASQSGRKVAIIFDADRMNAAASNSFLKTLEEPPEHSLLLLVSAHPEMLLETILSRCIMVSLVAPERRELPESQRRLLEAIARFVVSESPRPGGTEIGAIYSLVHEFSSLLGEAKAAIADEGASELKNEEKLYKQTTDGKWLGEREEYYKALAESRYLQARTLYVETLLQWWGDVLRQQHHATGSLDFPAFADQTGRAARQFSTPDVLRRVKALEGLRENFGRNVQEQLAVEVAFLEAFRAA